MLCVCCQAKGMDLLSVREGRYDAIFHLVTAAFGAEEFYTLANNPDSRTETVEQAREVRPRKAYKKEVIHGITG